MSVIYVLQSELVKVDNSVEVEFKNKNAQCKWNSYCELFNNLTNIGIIKFARLWAKYMQLELAKGKSFESIVEESAIKAGCSEIPDWQYSQALNILCDVWKHGNELANYKNRS